MKITLLVAILAVCTAAQPLAEPPNLIRIVRNGSIQPYANGRAATNVLGMSAISGLAEAWLVELHDSYESLEDLDRILGRMPVAGAPLASDDVLAPSRTMIAEYRPELSHAPDQAIQMLPRSRYLDVTICRIRPGAESDFANLLKLRGFALDSTNADRAAIVYQVISGAPSGTYIFLAR